MRIIRFESDHQLSPLLGCIEGDQVYSIKGNLDEGFHKDKLVADLKNVKLLAPCIPSKVVAVAINFPGIGGYSLEMSEPMVFVKPNTCICNPGDLVVNPFPSLPWWGEAELGVVIRKTLKNVLQEDVHDGILGFTIGNDVTVENVERRDHHLARSKCSDRFCPIGPWIDTEFDASHCLIEAVQDGEVIRRAYSSEQVWQWPKIVSWLSSWMTLNPWDVILTGNPPDTVGMRYIGESATYTARIKGLGELTNFLSI